MKSICVYCGSNPGSNPLYSHHAQKLGQVLALLKITLVYGGSHLGLMGLLADSALENGGRVIGVIPRTLVDQERAHPSLSELEVVANMHERKRRMCDLAEGFIALPGGFGTLEEVLEQATWSQLGLQKKPVGFLNSGGYYSRLFDFLEHAAREGFLSRDFLYSCVIAEDPLALVGKLTKMG
ncbi:MAG TPA: TIGR00730 family Rossman fold protein [bacterium]|nr:TIGR00730 family Rossman fold protein [bacterium]